MMSAMKSNKFAIHALENKSFHFYLYWSAFKVMPCLIQWLFLSTDV